MNISLINILTLVAMYSDVDIHKLNNPHLHNGHSCQIIGHCDERTARGRRMQRDGEAGLACNIDLAQIKDQYSIVDPYHSHRDLGTAYITWQILCHRRKIDSYRTHDSPGDGALGLMRNQLGRLHRRLEEGGQVLKCRIEHILQHVIIVFLEFVKNRAIFQIQLHGLN